jgi:hypothetical protein
VETAAPVNPAIAWFVDLETFIDCAILDIVFELPKSPKLSKILSSKMLKPRR